MTPSASQLAKTLMLEGYAVAANLVEAEQMREVEADLRPHFMNVSPIALLY